MKNKISLLKLQEEYKNIFISDLQKSFSLSITKKIGLQKDEVISWEEVNSCITAPNAEAFNIIYNDRIVGGVVVTINNDTNINLLDLIFIKSEYNNLGIGYDVWKIIEAKYTNTKKWITITPYFEERNIHFYINKCGFKIVDFFNQNHIDPKVPRNRIPELNCYFKFEKK